MRECHSCNRRDHGFPAENDEVKDGLLSVGFVILREEMDNFTELLAQRCQPRPAGRMDVRTCLRHFALINYALPRERLLPFIPQDRFSIPEYEIGGKKQALLSAVPFFDDAFHFDRLPFPRYQFGQTNHRVYVVDKRTGEHVVWFFGTTLGSPVVYLPRIFWKIPWHRASYKIDCPYDQSAGRYSRYRIDIASKWCSGHAELEDTGRPLELVEGFDTLDQLKLIVTHPLTGFYHGLDGKLGTFSADHDAIRMTVASPVKLYFSLYERLGLLSKAEMERPHSIFLGPETWFLIHLPPKRI